MCTPRHSTTQLVPYRYKHVCSCPPSTLPQIPPNESAKSRLSKTFSIPQDLILPEYETLEPIERLLATIATPLRQRKLGYRVDEKHERLTIFPAATADQQQAA